MKLPDRFRRLQAGAALGGLRLKLIVLGGLILALLGGAGFLWWQEQQRIARQAELLAEAERVGGLAESPQVLARCKSLDQELPPVIAKLAEEPNRQADIGRARRALGQCYTKLRRYNDAVRELRAAIELRPEFAPLHGEMALALSRNGQHAQARRWVRLAVQLDPLIWQAHRAEARVLDAARLPEEARAAYAEALKLAPPDVSRGLEDEKLRMLRRHGLAPPAAPASAAAAPGAPPALAPAPTPTATAATPTAPAPAAARATPAAPAPAGRTANAPPAAPSASAAAPPPAVRRTAP